MDQALSLYRYFKLIKASESKHIPRTNAINLLSKKVCLLSASFEVNGYNYDVMIDTGASISLLPEFGAIMKKPLHKMEKTNMLVTLANGKDDHISSKIKALIKPKASLVAPRLVKFYIQPGAKDILGYHALIGLNHLKLFDLNISSKDDRIRIYHNNKLIGQETIASDITSAGIKVIDKISPTIDDVDIRHVLKKYKVVFSDINEKPINGTPMRFYTTTQRPIFAKQRHYTVEEVGAMKLHIKSLLEQGIIEPSDSGYAATSRIIPKKNGTGRLVVNYIPLNAVTYRDSYALPHISDILGVLQGQQYFSTMDCAQGFYQIAVDQRDRHKTGFSTPLGNFQFRRCPFGARNSCAKFQAEMNRIFFDGLYKRCVIHVDDILVFGRDRSEHDANLEWVLQRCAQFNVKLKLEKCHFAKREVQYLGFMVSGEAIKPIPSKVDSLSTSKPPRDKTELRSIIGKLNFYSRFIPRYSSLLEPLRTLLTKNKDYQWKQYHQEAFESLIQQLNKSESHLLTPRQSHKYIAIHILKDSVEVILTTNENELITRTSRLLSTAESNYSQVEKQLLGLVFGINKFRLILDPENFTVKIPDNGLSKAMNLVNRTDRIDHWLLKLPEGYDTFKFETDGSAPIAKHMKNKSHIPQEVFYVDGASKANGKQNCRASWAVCAEFDRDIELKGYVDKNPSNQSAELTAAIKACQEAKRLNLNEITIVTDSKYIFNAATEWIDKWKINDWKDNKNKPVINQELFKELLYAKEGLDIQWLHVKGHSDNAGNNRADLIAKSLLDKKTETLCALALPNTNLQRGSPQVERLKQQIRRGLDNDFRIIDDNIYRIDTKLPEGSQERMYVPQESRYWLLNLAHNDEQYGGHLGIKKTFNKLIRFWWPKMHHDVETYVKSCQKCQLFKNPVGLSPGYLHSIPVSEIFEHIHIDIVGPMKTTYHGNAYIITATDAFSKWVFAKPSQRVRTDETIEFIENEIFVIHGKPKRIITDQGTQFTSKEFQEFITKAGIEHRMTTSYHPQTNGIDERVNGTVIKILRYYTKENQIDWDDHLKWTLYLYNNTVHNSTGYSPYQVLFSRDSRSPLKPTHSEALNQLCNNDFNNTAEAIRADVNERNKRSQDVQSKYYNRKRTKPKFYVGQFVYLKVHTPTTGYTKKLSMNWEGPVVIIGFTGTEDEPKAVRILNIEGRWKKTVAITDIKPVIDTYEETEDSITQSQNGGGNTFTSSSDSQADLYHPSYYISYGDDKVTDKTTSSQNNDQAVTPRRDSGLNITQKTIHGPITSSPRRVTISDDVQTRIYDRHDNTMEEETFEDAHDEHPQQIEESRDPNTAPADKPQNESLHSEDSQVSETTEESSTSKAPNINQQPRRDSTVYDYADNIHSDPTYRPPNNVLIEQNITQRTDQSSSTASQSGRNTGSLIPRPVIRTHKMLTRAEARRQADEHEPVNNDASSENLSTMNERTSSNESIINDTTASTDRSSSLMRDKSNTIASLVNRFMRLRAARSS